MTTLLDSLVGWEQIVRSEYAEVPGLQLTLRQAQRLWNLDAGTCAEVLDALVQEHFLTVTEAGAYARADVNALR